MGKPFQDLDLNNAFLFAAALKDPETCQLVLEIILGCKLSKVEVQAEHTILFNSDFKSIRLDIYARDQMQVHYNVEAQNKNQHNLPKRSRYHQAKLDVTSLKPGEDFDNLKPSYVVFICSFDPFDKGLYRYTFEERCLERDFGLGDETRKIFLNTKGKNKTEVPPELIHFLEYMEKSTDEYVKSVTDETIAHLHKKVTTLKRERDLEESYMTFEELLIEREQDGREEGIAKGRSEGIHESKVQSIFELLEDYGTISEELHRRVQKEQDLTVLKNWHKLAAKVTSIGEFEEKMNLLEAEKLQQ